MGLLILRPTRVVGTNLTKSKMVGKQVCLKIDVLGSKQTYFEGPSYHVA